MIWDWFLKEVEPVYIGEVYLKGYRGYSPQPYYFWMKFTAEDREIYKDHDGFLHICGSCHLKEDVMFYDKVQFGAAREKIERKYNGQKSN